MNNHLLVAGVLLAVIGVDSTFVARLVTDLTLKGLSLNQIREHLRLIYSLDLTKHELQKLRYKAAQKAKEVNHELDLPRLLGGLAYLLGAAPGPLQGESSGGEKIKILENRHPKVRNIALVQVLF